jgi:uncharacterized protein
VTSVLFTSDGALRAPWRLGLFLAALAATGVTFSLLQPALSIATSWLQVDSRILTFSELLALLGATWIMLRWIDRRTWSTVAMGRRAAAPRTLGFGAGAGSLAILVPCVVLLGIGWLVIVPGESGSVLATAAGLTVGLLVASLTEELLVRGYMFAVLRKAVGDIPTLVVSSTIFGALHLWNPGAGIFSIAMVTLAGFFLGGVLLVTESLYAAWMAHAAWNWVLAVLLHAPLSGISMASPGYRTVARGPDWATGGDWGPEGSVLAAISLAIATIYLVRRLVGRQEMTEWKTASQ